MEKERVKLHLKNGNVIMAEYEIDEYDDIYYDWKKQGNDIVSFINCAVISNEIIAIEWGFDAHDLLEE